jgi:hypothetical protein
MDLKPCPECANLTAADNDACPYCGSVFGVLAGDPRSAAKSSGSRTGRREIRNPTIAGLCSFLFPGWGQWYNGRTLDGIYIISAAVAILVVSALCMVFIRDSSLVLTFIALATGIALLVMWVYSVVNAYNSARGINRGGTRFSGKSVLFWIPATLWAIAAGVIFLVLATPFYPDMPGAWIVPYVWRAMSFFSPGSMGW